MRVSSIVLTVSITVFASSNAAWAARILDRAAISELTSTDLVQPVDDIQRTLNNQRFLRNRDTDIDDEDLGDGLNEDTDDEERGFGSELFAKIAAEAAKFDDINAKVATMTKDKSLGQQFGAYLGLVDDNVELFRKLETQGYNPASLTEKLTNSRNKLDKNQAKALSAAFEDF